MIAPVLDNLDKLTEDKDHACEAMNEGQDCGERAEFFVRLQCPGHLFFSWICYIHLAGLSSGLLGCRWCKVPWKVTIL